MIVQRYREKSGVSPFAMSFLDTVSAGFGAAFFLFVIFASLPIVKSSGMLGSSQFIQFELTWDDPSVVLYPQISFNGQKLGKLTSNPFTGQIIINGKKGLIKGFWQDAYLFGGSEFGSDDITQNEEKRSLKILLLGPCSGEWEFELRSRSLDAYWTSSSGIAHNGYESNGWVSDFGFKAKLSTKDTGPDKAYTTGKDTVFGFTNPAMKEFSDEPGTPLRANISWIDNLNGGKSNKPTVFIQTRESEQCQ